MLIQNQKYFFNYQRLVRRKRKYNKLDGYSILMATHTLWLLVYDGQYQKFSAMYLFTCVLYVFVHRANPGNLGQA